MFICASGEKFNFAKEIGVGLVDTAMMLSSIVLRDSPKELIFIGSAGSYDKKINIFDIFVSSTAMQIESSFITHNSYTPIFNKIVNVSHETHNLENNIIVNSSNYITTDEDISRHMTKAEILLENMEFFSILRVAQYFEIPAFGIFCVTNYCDLDAHESFLKNHKSAKDYLESYIRENYGKYF